MLGTFNGSSSEHLNMSEQDQTNRGNHENLLPHWYKPNSNPITIVSGSGTTVTDNQGNEYLDCMSQLYCVNAGHGETRIIDAIREQLDKIAYVSPAKGNDTRSAFVNRLLEIAPNSITDVFLAISGSEANEAAAQFARSVTGGQKILTRWRSYHGSTYGAASLTGDPQTRAIVERDAATTGAVKFLPPMTYRSPFSGDTPDEIADQAADHLEFVIRNEGPDSIAAILMEPVAGTSGAYTAPPGYFGRVRELCDTYDILLIADEVITGFGRCGEWFGIQTESIEPDMITFAKGATSAYVPLAGVMVQSDIADHLRSEGIAVGQTFAGNPLGCAAGVAALDVYSEGLIDNAKMLELPVKKRLQDLANRHSVVGSVHGRGLLWSVEIADPETSMPFFDPRTDTGINPVKQIRAHAEQLGVLFGSGRPDTQLLLAPPLPITENEIDHAVSVLDESISAIFSDS